MQINTLKDLVQCLAWQTEMGADEVIGDTPTLHMWRGQPNTVKTKAVAQNAAQLAPTATAAPTLPPQTPTISAPAFAGKGEQTYFAPAKATSSYVVKANTLAELETEIQNFEGCPLKLTAIQLVFGSGPLKPEAMFIGETPGEAEDRQGQPFVGPAGKLLDQMLASIGLDRTNTYLSNCIYWRPPGNRSPTESEISACLPFVEKQIALVQPKVVIVMGGVAAKALLRMNEGITKLRGQLLTYVPCTLKTAENQEISVNPHAAAPLEAPLPCLPMLHPNFLLRQPMAKRQAWQDLLLLRKVLTGLTH